MKVSEMEARGTKTLVGRRTEKRAELAGVDADERVPPRGADDLVGGAGHGRGTVLAEFSALLTWGAIDAPDAGDGIGVPECFDSGGDRLRVAARFSGT